MNAEFFALAFVAALNPKLLAIDLLLIEKRRPRAMFLCVLLGGMAVALTIGLLDVLVWHADAINSQKNGERGRGPGALGGIPGGVYLSALHILVTSKSSTANQVAGVVLFVVSSSRW